jgi:hypothetical protein
VIVVCDGCREEEKASEAIHWRSFDRVRSSPGVAQGRTSQAAISAVSARGGGNQGIRGVAVPRGREGAPRRKGGKRTDLRTRPRCMGRAHRQRALVGHHGSDQSLFSEANAKPRLHAVLSYWGDGEGRSSPRAFRLDGASPTRSPSIGAQISEVCTCLAARHVARRNRLRHASDAHRPNALRHNRSEPRSTPASQVLEHFLYRRKSPAANEEPDDAGFSGSVLTHKALASFEMCASSQQIIEDHDRLPQRRF